MDFHAWNRSVFSFNSLINYWLKPQFEFSKRLSNFSDFQAGELLVGKHAVQFDCFHELINYWRVKYCPVSMSLHLLSRVLGLNCYFASYTTTDVNFNTVLLIIYGKSGKNGKFQ